MVFPYQAVSVSDPYQFLSSRRTYPNCVDVYAMIVKEIEDDTLARF